MSKPTLSKYPAFNGTLPTPSLVKQGDIWRFNWPEEAGPEARIIFEVSRVRDKSDATYGEILVKYGSINGASGHIYGPVTANLTGPKGRTEVVNALQERRTEAVWSDQKSYALRWQDMVEYLCREVVEKHREGRRTIRLTDVPEPPEIAYVVDKLILDHETSMLFCDGGGGKSFVSLYLSILVALGISQPPFRIKKQCNVLYLDWEVEEDESRRREGMILRGLGFDDAEGLKMIEPRLYYRHQDRPIADDVDRINRDIAELGIGLVVIDSAVPASGGNPNEADTARWTMQAIRQLYPAARLVIAHVSKNDAANSQSKSTPFGSAFYRNLARSAWELTVPEESVLRTEQTVISEGSLIHRKVNIGRIQEPIGLTLKFDDAARVFEIAPFSVVGNAALAKQVSDEMNVRSVLMGGGEMTLKRIQDASGLKEYKARKALDILIDKGEVTKREGVGKPSVWWYAEPEPPPTDDQEVMF